MNQHRVVGLVGSYRRDGVVDKAVSEVLAEASRQGAETRKISLIDERIEFCTNCRECMQFDGAERGKCVLTDEMEGVLETIEQASALVLGSPVNFGNVTALTRRFMERCVGYSYWPWHHAEPIMRQPRLTKRAVLVSASGAPARRRGTYKGALEALKYLATLLGARSVGVLCVHRVNQERMELPASVVHKAHRLGRRLAT